MAFFGERVSRKQRQETKVAQVLADRRARIAGEINRAEEQWAAIVARNQTAAPKPGPIVLFEVPDQGYFDRKLREMRAANVLAWTRPSSKKAA